MSESANRLMGNWLNFKNFDAWKLQTGWDYVFFGILLLMGFLLFFFITRHMKKKRNHEDAMKRVAKRMNRLGGKNAVTYMNKTVRTVDGDSCFSEMISVVKDRLYVVKVYHYCMEVRGSLQAKEWEFRANKDVWNEANPMPVLDEQRVVLTRLLLRNNLRNIPVQPLVVFADSFGTTQFKLPGVKNAVPYRMMRVWRRTYKLDRTAIDIAKVCEVLEKSFVEPEAPAEEKA